MTAGRQVHVFEVRVFYEDTDMGGIVYHANHLKFCERARSDWVESLGIDQEAMRLEGHVFAVTRMEADWRAPARYGERLRVETRAVEGRRARLVMAQRVLRAEAVLFEARVTVATITLAGRPVRLPPAMRAVLGGA